MRLLRTWIVACAAATVWSSLPAQAAGKGGSTATTHANQNGINNSSGASVLKGGLGGGGAGTAGGGSGGAAGAGAGGGGGGRGAPMPALGLTLLGQAVAGSGLYLLWRRRRRAA